jgi:CubicO group peptidase (beta-lactamase class C family)
MPATVPLPNLTRRVHSPAFAPLGTICVAIFVLGVSACISPGAGQTQRGSDPATAFALTLDSLIPAVLARTPASGAVVAVVEAGRVRLTKGYGIADKATGRPMTDSTPVPVASVSKLVSTWGIMGLVARGRLPLDRPIAEVVTGWRLPPSGFDPSGVTVRRLLSHTAGLSMLSVPCFPADSARPSEEDVLTGRAGGRGRAELVMAPGAEWRYSGGGFTLLQLAARERTAEPFARLMENRVFQPLGMRSTRFGIPDRSTAVGYDDGGTAVRPIQCVGEAAAGLITTARDMARLLLEYGRARRGRSAILPGRWIDTVATPVAKAALTVDGNAIDMGDARMGLGHFLHATRDGRRILFHSGGNPGTGAYVLVDLDRDTGFFLAINSDAAGDVLRAVLSAWGAAHHTDPPTFF